MAVISVVPFSRTKQAARIDAEYYQPHLIQYEKEINGSGLNVRLLGEIIHGGYRVIYENTKMIDEPLPSQKTVRFLQAANIPPSFPTIDFENVGLMSYADWKRYPKGRIRRGEILVEVKGKASKVAIVPDDYPLDTLITGTVYKFLVDENAVHQLYLLAYLLSKYRQGFRTRCLTNSLIGFVNKEELYRIPVPLAAERVQKEIAHRVSQAFSRERQSTDHYATAEGLLLSELGLGDLDLSPTLFYERDFSDAQQAARLDAEFFQPRYYRLLKTMEKTKRAVRLDDILLHCERGLQPEYDDDGDVVVVNTKHMGVQFPSDPFERCTEDAWERQRRAQLQQYDVLFYSTGAYIGRTNCWFNDCKAIASNHVTIIRPKERCNPVYLSLFMNSQAGLMQADRRAHGSAQREVYPPDIRAYTVWLPTMRKQEKFAQMLLDSKAARDESRHLLDEGKRMVEEAVLGKERV